MLTRLLGDVVDAALALIRLRGAGRSALSAGWRVLPGDLLGRLVLRACGVSPCGARVDAGRGGHATLIADPRLARYLDAAPLRPYAQTLGGFILSREPLPDAIVRHELVHVRQWAQLGPLFLPLYGASSARAMLWGADRYRDNAFEVAARAAEAAPGS